MKPLSGKNGIDKCRHTVYAKISLSGHDCVQDTRVKRSKSMKKITFCFFLGMFLMYSGFTMDSASAKKMNPCLFNGTVNGVKVKSFECSIVHGAGPSYLLLSLDFGGNLWMMDLSGVAKKTGNADFVLVAKKHDGKKFSEHYSGKVSHNVFQNPKAPVQFGIFNSSIILKDANGKSLPVKGDFVWDTSRFPN